VGTLKQIAEMGYKGVEFAGIYDNDPKEIRKVIDDLGLVPVSTHTALPTKENIQEILDVESVLGTKYWISGFPPDQMETLDQFKAAAAEFQSAAEVVKPHGVQFGFHNHWWEFRKVDDQRYGYDVLMAEAPSAFSELDTYWCVFGGGNVIDTINKYKSRIPLYHIKDGTLEDGVPQRAIGSGKMDFPAVVRSIDQDVAQWLIVENDDADVDMMEAARLGIRYLVGEGLGQGK
jgi:sugar phosphate isomerase/epimerase